jgi:peptidyl-prolyl cis-trans isomerase D
MLDAMRRGVANLLAKVLLGLLIIAFAVWGIGDYLVRGPQQGALATIGKTQISVDEYKQAYNIDMQLEADKLGRAPTPEQAQLIPVNTLRRLIESALLELHAKELGITTADDVVGAVIRGGNPEIVSKDGRIDKNKYIEIVRQSGARSLAEYESHQKRALTRGQLIEAVGMGVVPQQFLIDAIYRYRDETRVIEYVAADFSKLVTVAEPSAEKLKAFFEQNQEKYKAPEERKANLLLVSRAEAMKRVKVTDDEVKAAYEAAKGTYNIPEQRRIQQLTFSDKAAAEKGYAELSKAKDAKDFEEKAGKLGFSAADMQLGSGLLTRAEMIDPKIAEAAFALKKDELSKPVEGQFAIVLVRVSEIAPGKQRSFDEVKGEIRDKLAEERTNQEIQSLHDKIEDERASGKPMKEIAEQLKLDFREIPASPPSRARQPRRLPRPPLPAVQVSKRRRPNSPTAATPGSTWWRSRRRSRRPSRRPRPRSRRQPRKSSGAPRSPPSPASWWTASARASRSKLSPRRPVPRCRRPPASRATRCRRA